MSDIKDNSTIVSMSRDVAVIGVGGRFPKADNIAEFYQNLKSSVDCVTEIDSERIQNTSIDHANYEIMGFLDDVDKFDYQFFNISKGEAELMDPHQRIMLEAVHETIESAGYSIEEFSNRITNLYVSSPIPAYYLHMNRIEAPAIIGNLPGISAGRIARHFNFTGNAALIDTTCSSSLVSIHMGYNDLIFNEADQVVVTGARISLFPSKKNGKSPLGIVSPDGKDRAFSADANGTSTGEACGVVILKRLDLAISDGDNILGIIKSTAVNQDADRSAFLTAPSKKAQTEVISKAWEKAEIDPRTVSFIEAHGTGTKLGDPIEIDALNEAFKRYTSDQHFCAVSAVKTNIGHTDAAAGICGFIKSILSLQHKVLFASLHFSEPNPMINFDDSAVYVNDKLKEWKADSDYPRRAGVSAFGMSGTNCHLVLEEAKPLTLSPSGLVDKSGGRYLFPFTSKSSNGLTEYLESFQDFLTSDIHTSIEDVSYTLSAGRTHYSHRIAFQAESLDSLRKQIESSLISGIETHKIGIQPSEYIIYFPNAIEDAKELITAFARSSTDYQFYLDECKKHYSDDQSNLLLYSFIFEYCTFKVLESKDLISQNLLGYGVGELAISVILKEMTLQEAIKQVLSYSHDQDDSFYERLGRYLRNMNQNKGTIFLDLGKDSEVEKLMILIERESQKSNIQHSSVTNESTLNGLIIDVKEKLFLGGVPIDWSKQYVKGGRKRVQLPTYKFQKERCWVKPPTMPGVTDHFYELVWKLQERSNDGEALENEVLLIFGANNDLSQNAVSLLNDSNTCIVVDHSQSFNKNTHIQYEINYHSEEDYFQLRESLKNDQISITGILHFGNYTPDFVSDSKSITSDFGLGLQSQFFIAKAFEDYLDSKSFHLSFISSFGQYIEGDTAHIPAHAASVAFIKSLVSNNPHLKARSIDLEYSPLLTPDNAQFILDEIRDNDTIKVVACRNGTRYVQELCKIEKSSFGTNDDKLPKDNEVYLITGGASGIGLSLANFLADNNKPCDIIILGRREVSNDVNPELYEGLLELEAKCRTVKYIAVDVSDKKGMDRAFSEIKQSYNQIAGVIHAAGVPGEWAKLSEKEFGDFSKTLDAKVQGSLLIYEHTSDLNPEYIAFCSSLNAIVPQRLSSEYAVANAFQDALATHLSQFSNQKVISIGWPGWKEIGMGVTDSKTNDEIGPLPLKRINTKDGLIAFDYATRLNKTHVLVADVDLSSFRINPFFNISSSENQQTVEVVNNTVASRPRVISTKDSIINIWKEVLKIDDISEKDDFFDLGGNSLNGTQVINHLDKQFEVDLEFEVLLENPRADELAAFIDDLKRNVGQDSVKEIKILEEQQYYSVSHAQKRLWIINQFEGSSAGYNMFKTYVVNNLKPEVFKATLDTLVERHESLRTVFIDVEGTPKQKILDLDESNFGLEQLDLRRQKDIDATVRQISNDRATRPFDLETGPLFRACLIQVDDEQFQFVFCMHHIICDGWSFEILTNEFYSVYKEISEGKEHQLESLPVSYKEFAAWQNEIVVEQKFGEMENYWINQFKDPIPTLELPTDFTRPAIKTYNGARFKANIGQALTQEIKKLCKENKVTLYMFLMASTKMLLHRFTGQKDIVVGTPIAGRNNMLLEKQIGLFLNTLSMRTKFESTDTFEGLLDSEKRQTLKAFENQLYPFDLLVDKLELKRDLSRSPIFDVMLVLIINNEIEENNKPIQQTLEFDSVEDELTVSKFDLSFNYMEVKDNIFLEVEYNTDLFARSSVENLVVNLRDILSLVTQHPQKSVEEIRVGGRKTQLEMLSRLNRTTGDLCDKTIIELFEEQVEHKPQSVALCYKDKQLTYLELDKVTNQTARYLIERWEIKPGVFVATAIDNSEWMIVLLLSILKAGAAYVPVGINYPMDRINRILQDCGTKVLITDQQGLLNVLYNLNVNIVDRLSIEKEIDRYENGRIDIARDTSSIMYSIYTSGSTGNPKGVVVEYNGVVNLIQWMWKEFEFDHRDIIIQKTPYIFDVSVWELFIGLCFGAKTVMCEREAIYDPGLLQDCLNDNCITVAHFVPTMLNVFLDYHTLNDQSNYSLKRLFVGGEELKKATVNKYYDQFEAPLYNLYGPTETSIYSTSDYVSPAESIISIGKPIDNTEIIILDEKMNPVPIGVNGMIYITGIGLARGYLNEVEKTHNSFTYNGMEGERSYCTGDVGRWLPDGRIRFIGRRDNQVKIRGHRIELSEIENAIISQVGIENAVVVVGQTQEETSILLAYYSGDSEISGVKIREHLIAQLPDYMLPEHYIWLNEIPKTANNKVDRKRLPDFKDKISKIQKSSELPQTATEKKLVEIWENVLGIKNIEVDSNFFEIGGHSLKAMNVVMEIHKQFNVSPKLKELFKQPTIKELSNVVDNLCAMDSYRHKSIEMDDQYESIVI